MDITHDIFHPEGFIIITFLVYLVSVNSTLQIYTPKIFTTNYTVLFTTLLSFNMLASSLPGLCVTVSSNILLLALATTFYSYFTLKLPGNLGISSYGFHIPSIYSTYLIIWDSFLLLLLITIENHFLTNISKH